MTNIRQATTADAETIQRLAEATWWPTYSTILTDRQIRYMLDLFYSHKKILSQLASGEQTYLLLSEDDVPVAFAAFSIREVNPDVYKLHKLYCVPEMKGRGYGKALMTAVEKAVREAGKQTLELNVNKYNHTAKNFYTRLGFTIAYDENIDIGNGYFMDDHVMRKHLQP